MTKRVTSREVAEAAGVSRTTVSFVLNGVTDQRIPLATRIRVQEAARDLNYRPSPEARTLIRGTSEIVLLLIPAWAPSTSMTRYLKELTRCLAEAGLFGLVHLSSSDDSTSPGAWESLTARAIVPFFDIRDEQRSKIEAQGTAVMPVNWFSSDAQGRDNVQRDIGAAQARALIERGYRRAAFATAILPEDSPFIHARFGGFVDAFREHGLPLPPQMPMALTMSEAVRVVGECHDARIPALAAFDDLLAVLLAEACRVSSTRVPDDLALLAVEDSFLLDMHRPGVSTVLIDIEGFAAAHAQRIVQALGLQGDGAPDSPRFAFVDRGSV